MTPVHPKALELIRGISAVQKLEKVAAQYPDDAEVQEKVAAVRARITDEIFGHLKESSFGSAIKSSLGNVGKGLGWGLGIGGGVAAPLALGGAALARYGRSQSEQTAENVGEIVRNKLLTGALGLAGIGLGTYGVSKLLGGAAGSPIDNYISQPRTPAASQAPPISKWGSAENEEDRVNEAIEKLAAVGVVDALLDSLPASLDEGAQKLAAEVRAMNRHYGVYVLSELCR